MRAISLSIVLAALFLVMPAFGDPQAEKAARAAAESWLTLVDAGKYGESWDEASSLFRSQVPREQWAKMASSVRGPLGKLVSRKPKSTQYTTTAPGAPDGEYVVVQFDTSYENKKSAVETVSPMKDKDGKWRVSGYFIR